MKIFKESLVVLTLLLGVASWVGAQHQIPKGTNHWPHGQYSSNSSYEFRGLNPLMAIDNARDRKNGKLRVEIFRGTESEVVYLNTTSWVASPVQTRLK
jgi:hypothetical protein